MWSFGRPGKWRGHEVPTIVAEEIISREGEGGTARISSGIGTGGNRFDLQKSDTQFDVPALAVSTTRRMRDVSGALAYLFQKKDPTLLLRSNRTLGERPCDLN